jgi:hypothetical protein
MGTPATFVPVINDTDFYEYASNDPSRIVDIGTAAAWRQKATAGLNDACVKAVGLLQLVEAVTIGETVMSADGFPLGPLPMQLRKTPDQAVASRLLQSIITRMYPATPWLFYVFINMGAGNPPLCINVAKAIAAGTTFTPTDTTGGGTTAGESKVVVNNAPPADVFPTLTQVSEPPQPPEATTVGGG